MTEYFLSSPVTIAESLHLKPALKLQAVINCHKAFFHLFNSVQILQKDLLSRREIRHSSVMVCSDLDITPLPVKGESC